MEDRTLENKFAMHLSGILKGMNFEQGLTILEALPCIEDSPALCSYEELDSAYGYKFRGECEVELEGMDEYGIDCIYFKINVNATREEMMDFLEEHDVYDSEEMEDWEEEEIVRAFWREFNDICFGLYYEELEGRFADMCTYWDLLLDEQCHYYRGGDQEIYQY